MVEPTSRSNELPRLSRWRSLLGMLESITSTHARSNKRLTVRALRRSFLILPGLLFAFAGVSAETPAYLAARTVPGPATDGQEIHFTVHRLGRDHAEGVTALDIDEDGYLDVASGAYWYRNPGAAGGTWLQTRFREVSTFGEFVDDTGEWSIDVDHDGQLDIVTVGWREDGVFWWHNPGPTGGAWRRRLIASSKSSEGGVLADVNGDGVPDLVVAHYVPSGILWIDFSKNNPVTRMIGGPKQDGHGVGVADLNADGKADILTPFGWFENAPSLRGAWQWHPDWRMAPAGFPILGRDVDGDGRCDIVWGAGHSYGLYWLQHTGTRARPHWRQRLIDESFSQAHTLALADLDGDGTPELVTGKRYRGHEGNDPGSYDPIGLFYYRIVGGRFVRHVISLNGTAGVGTQILAADLDQDGDVDLVTAGKTGLHLIENLRWNRVSREQRERELLMN